MRKNYQQKVETQKEASLNIVGTISIHGAIIFELAQMFSQPKHLKEETQTNRLQNLGVEKRK